jgi:hypothetical protein
MSSQAHSRALWRAIHETSQADTRPRPLPVGQNTPPPRQSLSAKIFHFTEIRNYGIHRNSPARGKRGGSPVVRNAGRVAVDAAASARGVRAGRVVPVSPRPACGRTALSSSSRQHSFGACAHCRWDPVASDERAYGKTVWSRPSLLRPSFRGGASEPNRADGIDNLWGEGGQKEFGSRESTA